MSFTASKFHKRRYGLHEQATRIRLIVGDFKYAVRRGQLVGRGSMQPAPACETYLFSLSYRDGENPTVKIIDPPLRCRQDQSEIPHTYYPDEPCLFRPGIDWSREQSLATTIIPWLAAWLFYYEMWHATGEWLGGGDHPETDEDQVVNTNDSNQE
jgi:hypothetical protein